MNKERILVMAHGHPDFSKGGGEIAAYNLFKSYLDQPEVEDAWFLARADLGRGATGRIGKRRDREYLWEQSTPEVINFKAANRFETVGYFAELLRALRPTVVHAHHYLHLGLEFLQVVKQVNPETRIVMTLHEYLGICMQNGQMVKRGSLRLCHSSDYQDCHNCFPEFSAEDMWLRKHRIMWFFDLVDQFIAPSEFLRQRYIDWGIAPERITVIENGQNDIAPLPPRPLEEGETRNRFGFFGQVNPFKGVDVLLQAMNRLSRKERKNIVLEIHGANLENQSEAFREKIADLRAPLEKHGMLEWVGPYEMDQLPDRMRAVDWVVVPSIWWENSPMVIQEAFALGRPVIASDIGGMAEKVTDGVNGRHVQTGNPTAWSKMLLELATSPGEWERLRAGIEKPIAHAECARLHLGLVSG